MSQTYEAIKMWFERQLEEQEHDSPYVDEILPGQFRIDGTFDLRQLAEVVDQANEKGKG